MLDAGLPANIEISAKDPIGAECTVPLSAARIASAKRAFTTRNIDFSDATRLLTANTYPEIGDLVLAPRCAHRTASEDRTPLRSPVHYACRR